MSGVDTAVLLAAGQGSRLRAPERLKPLCKVGGKALIDHAIDGLGATGIERVIVVTGFEASEIEAHLERRDGGAKIEVVRTADWRQPNGVSARAAAPRLGGTDSLLAMCDHLVDPALYRRLALAGPGPGLRLAIDRRIGHAWVDETDVTRVRTEASRIVAIGKGLQPYDAYDAGVFAVSARFFAVLERLDSPSISQAVEALAADGGAEVVDCSDLDWIDVDDLDALAKAEAWLAGSPMLSPQIEA